MIKQQQQNLAKEGILSPMDSLFLKGLAIAAMLWHHLFYTHPEYGSLIYRTSQLGKICVAIFLLISGYGVAHQYCNSREFHASHFLWHRLVKFYMNYWVVFLIVVPIGVFFYGRTLTIAYGNTPILSLLQDFCGMGGVNSYNITWWFNSLIIELYLLSPVLFYCYSHKKWLILGVAFCLQFIPLPPFLDNLGVYLFAFVLGIALKMDSGKINFCLKKRRTWVLILLLATILILRQIHYIPFLYGTAGDAWGALFLALIVIRGNLTQIKIIAPTLQFLGKHSMNIYMVHTFVIFYFYKELTYSFPNPILMFLFVLISSLCFSVVIEKGKKAFHMNNLINKLINK